MRKYYWYISAFIRKRGVVVLASVVIAVIVFSLALPFLLKILNFKPREYIGVIGRPTLTSLPPTIQNEISLGLTKLNADGSASPSLAERWSVEDDGKTYRFLLKRNLKWQDGQILTPTDITYNLNNVQIVKNSNEVIFKLPTPYAPFPTVVAQPVLRVIQTPYLLFFTQQKIIGLGQYSITDYKERYNRLTELTLDSETQQHIYRFYLTEDEALNAFKRGEVDKLQDLSSVGDVQDWPTVNIASQLDKQSVLGIFFHVQDPLFGGKEVIQALDYALPKPTDDSRVLGPISPNSWAFANVSKTYDFDEGRAVDRLLANPPPTPLHFTLTTTNAFSADADAIKKAWEDLGKKAIAECQSSKTVKDKSVCANLDVQVTIRITNFPDIGNFQALLIGQQFPIDPDQYALWHSKQETNFTGYANVRIDSLLEKGRQVTDQKQRMSVYQDFQQFFSDDAPVIYLRYLEKFSVQRKGK